MNPSNNFNAVALLNNRDAATYLGVSAEMLRLSRHTGELFKGVPSPQFVKMGSAVRYYKTDLDSWMANQPKFQSTAQSTLFRRNKS